MRRTSRSRARTKKHRPEHSYLSKELRELRELFSPPRETRQSETWYSKAVGIVAPFIAALFGLAVLMLGIGLLNLLNLSLSSGFITIITAFLVTHLPLFLALFTFFSYSTYLARQFPAGYRPLAPVIDAVGITVGFWIAALVLHLINPFLGTSLLTTIAMVIQARIPEIFLFFTVVGYGVLVLRTMTHQERPEKPMPKALTWHPRPLNLYRSSTNRIMGGVCGGVAEHFNIHPVIVRILWLLSCLVWGAGIAAYLILWLLLPRNPMHKWDR